MRAMARGLRYERLVTERANRATAHLDRLDARRIAALMNREDARAVRAVGRVARDIASAVDLIVQSLGAGGRLIFVGAGTSGRLGVLEAAECPPTFGTSPTRVQAIMAGGRASVFRSREGAEDDARAGARAVRARAGAGDVVVGVSASGVTPFVRGALAAARAADARTVLVTCNSAGATWGRRSGAANARAGGAVDVVIAPGGSDGIDTAQGRNGHQARPEHAHNREHGAARQGVRQPHGRRPAALAQAARACDTAGGRDRGRLTGACAPVAGRGRRPCARRDRDGAQGSAGRCRCPRLAGGRVPAPSH
jgi:phosphoheptose isomerase